LIFVLQPSIFNCPSLHHSNSFRNATRYRSSNPPQQLFKIHSVPGFDSDYLHHASYLNFTTLFHFKIAAQLSRNFMEFCNYLEIITAATAEDLNELLLLRFANFLILRFEPTLPP
jgi:hypothetical protein